MDEDEIKESFRTALQPYIGVRMDDKAYASIQAALVDILRRLLQSEPFDWSKELTVLPGDGPDHVIIEFSERLRDRLRFYGLFK